MLATLIGFVVVFTAMITYSKALRKSERQIVIDEYKDAIEDAIKSLYTMQQYTTVELSDAENVLRQLQEDHKKIIRLKFDKPVDITKIIPVVESKKR